MAKTNQIKLTQTAIYFDFRYPLQPIRFNNEKMFLRNNIN